MIWNQVWRKSDKYAELKDREQSSLLQNNLEQVVRKETYGL